MNVRLFRYFTVLAVAFYSLTACNLVKEDLDDCQDVDFRLDYQLRLVTNITTELQTELGLQADLEVKGLLEEYLKDIFTDFAKDVDLSFYDVDIPMRRKEHKTETMNGSESSYTLTLAAGDYMHLAVANIASDSSVRLLDDQFCKDASLTQKIEDNLAPAHTTGLFTARKEIDVKSGINQHFDVKLYMVNAASALVINMEEAVNTVESVTVFVEGMATNFNIADSVYTYNLNPQVATTKLRTADGNKACFASVHFPSKPAAPSGVIIQVDDDDVTADEALWQWNVLAKMTDGTITKSTLKISQPLDAGHIRILNAKMGDNGVVTTNDMTVSVSITLDWTPGIDFPVIF